MSDWKRISSLANVRRGASPRPIGDPSYFGGDVGWVRISDVTRSSRFLRETEQYVSPLGESMSVRVNPGDLVMSICGTLGRPIIIDIPACIHDGFVQFTNLKDVDPVFLFYTLQYSETKFNGMGQPGTQTNLNTTLVGRLEIFAPHIDTQRRIASILTTLDEEIEATEALIAKHQQIKAGLMHDLFTRGLWTQAELDRGDHKGFPSEASAKPGSLRPTPEEAPGLYQETEIGLITKEWQVKSFDEIVTAPICYGIVLEGPYTDGGVLVAAPYNIHGDWDHDLHRCAPDIDQAYARSRVIPGDVLLSVKGTIGRVGMVPPGFFGNISRGLARLRPSAQIRSEYLAQLLQSPGYSAYLGLAVVGSTRAELSIGPLRRLKVPIPPIAEQSMMEDALASAVTDLTTETTHLAKLRQQKQGLMHDLLTGRVRTTS